uniref:Uncharacterized protein n=1 Tax=Arundo donax TaxID=35708 RepID=A0A0A9BL05_ARUDO
MTSIKMIVSLLFGWVGSLVLCSNTCKHVF